MALKKTEIIYNGETVEYHRLSAFEVDMATGACRATMHSWSTPQERDKNDKPKLARHFNFLWVSEDMVADAYMAVKALPYWSDAEDV